MFIPGGLKVHYCKMSSLTWHSTWQDPKLKLKRKPHYLFLTRTAPDVFRIGIQSMLCTWHQEHYFPFPRSPVLKGKNSSIFITLSFSFHEFSLIRNWQASQCFFHWILCAPFYCFSLSWAASEALRILVMGGTTSSSMLRSEKVSLTM